MSDDFFNNPILNSPYAYPDRHWELDEDGQPTERIVDARRRADFVTPIPKAKKRKGKGEQQDLAMDEGEGLSTKEQQYAVADTINRLRKHIENWRRIPDASQWKVTAETARLLKHWRHHDFQGIRPFFCQVEAVETLIWLTEVAPKSGNLGKGFLKHLEDASLAANPELLRIALKLATGAGKTTVMAMIIAWQTINAVRRPTSKNFTNGFLIVAPGITIRDRLRVLLPNDTENYYQERELVPTDLMQELGKAEIVITNYHAFKLRERMDLAKGSRALLQGRGEALDTLETEGQMLQRVMPSLMGKKNILVLNDEAHHCYREKPGEDDQSALKGDDRKEAEKNNEAARLWISGLEMVKRKLGLRQVVDLSATPFFLSGSGYAEGTLFPWTASDFSLMDAIECGIVKLPRVPIADNVPGGDTPMFRNLWDHIGKALPKKGREKGEKLDPQSLPPQLLTALDALYGHYKETFELWQKHGFTVPPCFIVVCNNTATSKLVYDYISGYFPDGPDGEQPAVHGHHELFDNFDEQGKPLARPNTLLIDSEQLESGEALDKNFRDMASEEIERFRYEVRQRTGDQSAADNLNDADLLREVMNTVGKEGRLGEQIRCVVSVSMLTEGWDANTVTHVLGVRAFGTQLLCEQVIGRALRRQSYELNEEGRFNTEYADVLGIPFDFTAKPVISKPPPPPETIQVKAIRPDRDALAIRFPRVAGYRVELPRERLSAEFGDDSTLVLTPDLIGATKTQNSGIIGAQQDLTLEYTKDTRTSTVLYRLTQRLIETKFRDAGDEPKHYFFMQLKRIAKQWLDNYLKCKGGTYPAQLAYKVIADEACEKIHAAITRAGMKSDGERIVKALLDPYNPSGSTNHVNFRTSKEELYQTSSAKCQVNWVVLDSDWEAEFCRVAEAHPQVLSYVKNHNLGLEVPYRYLSEARTYLPDFIVLVDDGRGPDDPLHLVVEIKGYRGEDAKQKKETMDTFWVPGVNNLGSHGRWAFAEFTDVYEMQDDFKEEVAGKFEAMISRHSEAPPLNR